MDKERLINHDDGIAINQSLIALNNSIINRGRDKTKTPMFGSCSDAELVEAIQKADAGQIDLENDYGWAVGDMRVVGLNSILNVPITSKGGYTATYNLTPLNTGGVIMTLVSKEHYDLSGGGKCNFAVLFHSYSSASVMYPFQPLAQGAMDYGANASTSTNQNGWKNSCLRTFIHNNFMNAISSDIRSIFKPFKVKSISTGGSKSASIVETVDNFTVPCLTELVGDYSSNTYVPTNEASNTHIFDLFSGRTGAYYAYASGAVITRTPSASGSTQYDSLNTATPSITAANSINSSRYFVVGCI